MTSTTATTQCPNQLGGCRCHLPVSHKGAHAMDDTTTYEYEGYVVIASTSTMWQRQGAVVEIEEE